jgi:hypothetical protein
VSSFTATPGSGQVTLSWTNPTDTDFAGVRIVRKANSAPASTTDGTVVYDSTGTGFTDTVTADGTTYYYKAFSHDEVPNYASGALASATPGDLIPPLNITVFVVAQGAANGEIVGSWTNPSDTDLLGVRFRYRNDTFPTSATDGIQLSDETGLPGVADAATWAGLNPELTYYIRGFAYDGAPNYASGTNASVSIKPKDLASPANVSSFTAVPGNGQVSLSWTNPGDADFAGVKILRKTGGYPTGPNDSGATQVYNSTGTSYTDTGLTNGTTYYYASFSYDEVPNYSSGAQASTTLEPTWATKANMPTGRYGMAAGVVNNKIYAIGGYNGSSSLTTVEEYDPATNTWTTKTPMPTSRYGLAAGVVNNKIYAIGGYGGLTTVGEYDPAINTWTNCSSFGGCASMPTGRSLLAVGVVNNKIYAIGGYNGSSSLTTVEEYDPATNQWTTKAPMLTGRNSLAVGVVNNKVYAIGGYYGSSTLTTVEEYDPATDQWTTKASMQTSRYNLAAGVVNNKLYAIGGWNSSSGHFAKIEEYDPATNTWTAKTSMPTSRESSAVGVVDNKIYVIGGWIGSLLNTVEEGTLSGSLPAWNNPPTAYAGSDDHCRLCCVLRRLRL